ncbi:MAG: Xaa-Pro peptidase family protein [Aquificota bacterium]|nr:Xaa-Pro peptidase family protein [Aquificota bacterium]
MKVREVQERIEREGLDAFLFSSQANVFYLSRFRSTHAYVVLTPTSRYLITDSRYYERAKSELKGWEVVLIKGRTVRFIKNFLKEIGARRVGYESDRVSCDLRRALRSTRIKWVGYSSFLRDIRVVKTGEEIERMKEGVSRSDRIFRELLEFVQPGMTELEVRRFIVDRIFREGASGESFPAIVASGEGSAIPHWETSGKRIKHGEPLLIDMGLIWDGYCTDFTRTLFLGRPDPEFLKVYTVVRDAHLFALEKVKAGNRIGDVDRTAREYISGKRLGRFFTHSTGHGIGVEIHEYPRVYHRGEDADRVIEEGMVFTVEPGVYLPGKFGVRLENIVVVKNGRGEPLSSIGLDLITL